MKHIQPFYYLVGLACMFILAGLVLFSQQMWTRAETSDQTIDPQTQNQADILYDFWFTATDIMDLSVDHDLSGIFFGTSQKTVTLLDRDRKLLWDKTFSTVPGQAKISSCGNYVVVGTDGGRLYFASTDQEYWWEDEGDPVELIAVSPTASWVAVARSQPETGLYQLELFNQDGQLKWTMETGPIRNIYLSSEYLEQANVFFTYEGDDGQNVVAAVNLDGNKIWSYQDQRLAAISRHGSRLAAVRGDRLIVYDSLGYPLWSTALPFEVINVMFNPQNYNRLLVYGNREGAGENLYYFDLADDLLWMKRIADGSLFAFTADGQYILTSSWRHYREDFTQMTLLDRDGNERNSWEVAMRVERLAVSGHPHLVVVCGEDGYIDLINIKPLVAEDENNTIPVAPLYSPVSTTQRADELRITLYFIDEHANLVPVTRSISPTENVLQAALDELILGPARGSALYRTIPDKDLAIEAFFEAGEGRLRLDLPPELAELKGSAQSIAALDSLLLTVSSIAGVREIRITVDNELIEVFGDGLALEQPLEPFRPKVPVFVPVASGNRYYLLIEEALQRGTQTADLEILVEQVVRRCRYLPFIPNDLTLLSLDIRPEHVRIDMSSSLRDVFPEAVSEQSRLQAALILDAIFMTVFANSRSQRVEIVVEGESWTPPAGYPSLSRFFRTPYFVNPEP